MPIHDSERTLGLVVKPNNRGNRLLVRLILKGVSVELPYTNDRLPALRDLVWVRGSNAQIKPMLDNILNDNGLRALVMNQRNRL
ncbi:MAG: hypothetical protein ACD_38C00054G0002 [uncultured bacterium]|nr:MAG: hypothetical protein ACD_38C00054G0002 [uncultured bacterium]HLC88237.1 hypothetical protein [Patescibacteria group bacterium]